MSTEQKDLFKQLEKDDVKVAGEAAGKMKEDIMKGGGGNYLGIGVHDVDITSVELTQAKTGTIGMKFNVENQDGKSDVTMWLSEAALPYTIKNVSSIVVHNAPEGDGKTKAKNFMANIVSAKELYEATQAFIVDAEKSKRSFQAFLSIKPDPSGATYTDKNGVERPSLVRDLRGWKPKETATQTVVAAVGGEVVVPEGADINNLPF